MTDPSADIVTTNPESPVSWHPSEQLRKSLLYGLVAVVVAGGMTSASTILEIAQAKQPGFTIGSGLTLASIIPEIWILLAYIRLANETGSDALKRTSIGLIATSWIIHLFVLGEVLGENEAGTLAVLVLLACLGLAVYCLYPLGKAAGGGSFAAVLLVWHGTRFLLQGVPGFRQQGSFLHFLVFVIVLAGLAGVTIYLWFGISLIGLRRQLGRVALVSGGGHLLALVALAGLTGWFISEIVAATNRPGANFQEFEDLVAPQLYTMNLFGLAGNLLYCLLHAMLFFFARQRRANLLQG